MHMLTGTKVQQADNTQFYGKCMTSMQWICEES